MGPFRFADELTAYAVSDPALRRHRLAKDILGILANGAAKTGSCYRSIGKLAERFETQPNSIRRSLRALVALGYLRMEIPPGRVVYTFFLPIDPALRTPPKEAPAGRSCAPDPRSRNRSPNGAGVGAPDPPPWGRQTPHHFGVHEASSGFGVHERGGRFGVHEAHPTSGYMSVPPVNRNEPEQEPFLNPEPPEVSPRLLTDDAPPPEAPAPTPEPAPTPRSTPAAAPRPAAPVLTLAEARTVDALAAALVDPRPQTVSLAANLMGTVLDGNGKFVGGLRKILWDGSQLGESAQADILDRFAKVLANPKGRGRRFMKEVRVIVPRKGAPPAPAKAVPVSPAVGLATQPMAAGDPERVALYRRFWPRLTPEVRQRHLAEGRVPAELVHEFSRTVHLGRASA